MLEIPFNTLRENDPRCTVFNTCGPRLYHYTTIKNLALILKSHSIRFNRLDRVNDPKEALSKEYANAQTLVFVSCWTDNPEETIPHWKIYGGFDGVRLEMPTLMFMGRKNNHKVTRDDRLYELDGIRGINGDIERRGNKKLIGQTPIIMGPTRIRYFDNEIDLIIQNVNDGLERGKYDLRLIGTQKLKQWSFEDEIRFRILAIFGYSTENSFDFYSPESFSETPVITEFIDIPLDPSAVDGMEICLGPKTADADYIMIEALCNQYAPKAIITKSQIYLR